jgi:hypothetical protein
MEDRQAERTEQHIQRNRDYGIPLHHRCRKQDKKRLECEGSGNERDGDPSAERDKADERGSICNTA